MHAHMHNVLKAPTIATYDCCCLAFTPNSHLTAHLRLKRRLYDFGPTESFAPSPACKVQS